MPYSAHEVTVGDLAIGDVVIAVVAIDERTLEEVVDSAWYLAFTVHSIEPSADVEGDLVLSGITSRQRGEERQLVWHPDQRVLVLDK